MIFMNWYSLEMQEVSTNSIIIDDIQLNPL